MNLARGYLSVQKTQVSLTARITWALDRGSTRTPGLSAEQAGQDCFCLKVAGLPRDLGLTVHLRRGLLQAFTSNCSFLNCLLPLLSALNPMPFHSITIQIPSDSLQILSLNSPKRWLLLLLSSCTVISDS